jgi:hypothetical protein
MSKKRIRKKPKTRWALEKELDQHVRREHRKLVEVQEPFAELLSGSYNPATSAIRLNEPAPTKRMLVLAHEISHAWLAQKHWGEAIKRIEQLQLLLFQLVNLIRYLILKDTARELYDREPELALLVVMSEDPAARKRISARMKADSAFLAGTKLIDTLNTRRILMEKESPLTHEAAGEWLGLKRFETMAGQSNESDKALFEKTFQDHRQGLITGRGLNAEAYRMMIALEEAWGADGAAWSLDAAGCPNLFQVPLIASSLADFTAHITSNTVSPDARLKRLSAAAFRDEVSWSRDGIKGVFQYLDPASNEPRIDVMRFNQLWYQEIVHSEFDQVFVALQKRIGLSEQTTYRERFGEYAHNKDTSAEEHDSNFHIFDDQGNPDDNWSAIAKPGKEDHGKTFKWIKKNSDEKNVFLETMKKDGVIE